MTKTNKKKPAAAKSAPAPKPAPHKSGKRTVWIAIGVALLLIVVIVALSGKGSGEGLGGLAGVSPEERKYIGRLLPADYEEPKLADIAVYTSTVKMTNITAADDGTAISIPVSDVTTNKIVYFEYAKPGADAIPLLAYLKASGKLVVGVSFCPPCEGEGQRIESDLTLTCESCGTKRDLEQGTGISGPCKLYPIDELPVKIVGERIVMEKAVLDGWTPQPTDRPVG